MATWLLSLDVCRITWELVEDRETPASWIRTQPRPFDHLAQSRELLPCGQESPVLWLCCVYIYPGPANGMFLELEFGIPRQWWGRLELGVLSFSWFWEAEKSPPIPQEFLWLCLHLPLLRCPVSQVHSLCILSCLFPPLILFLSFPSAHPF